MTIPRNATSSNLPALKIESEAFAARDTGLI